MPLASDFGTGQVFLSMLWFFLFFIWIWLLIVVFSGHLPQPRHGRVGEGRLGDRHHHPAVPGRVLYLIARGHKMAEHAQQAAAAQDAAAKAVHPAGRRHHAAAPPTRSQRLADLKAQGVISDAEFEAGEGQGARQPEPLHDRCRHEAPGSTPGPRQRHGAISVTPPVHRAIGCRTS